MFTIPSYFRLNFGFSDFGQDLERANLSEGAEKEIDS